MVPGGLVPDILSPYGVPDALKRERTTCSKGKSTLMRSPAQFDDRHALVCFIGADTASSPRQAVFTTMTGSDGLL